MAKVRIQKTPDWPQDGRSPSETVQIPLNHGFYAKIDAELYPIISKYKWKAVKSAYCWYAVAKVVENGKISSIRMHRLIAETPPNMDCHHKNFITLDNRRENLCNLDPELHQLLHRYHKLQKT